RGRMDRPHGGLAPPAQRAAGSARQAREREWGRPEMIGTTGEVRKGCRQIYATSKARATWAQRRGSGQRTGRAGTIRGRNLADGGSAPAEGGRTRKAESIRSRLVRDGFR